MCFEYEISKINHEIHCHIKCNGKCSEIVGGRLLILKYGNYYHLQHIDVSVQSKGYGTKLLEYVLQHENIPLENMSVQPITYDINRFYQRHTFGFVISMETKKNLLAFMERRLNADQCQAE